MAKKGGSAQGRQTAPLHPDAEIIDMLGAANVARMLESNHAGRKALSRQAVDYFRKNGLPAARRQVLQLLRPEAFEPGAVERYRAERAARVDTAVQQTKGRSGDRRRQRRKPSRYPDFGSDVFTEMEGR